MAVTLSHDTIYMIYEYLLQFYMQVSYEFLYAKTYRLQETVMLSVSGNVVGVCDSVRSVVDL